jgi:hypothetical protein
LDGVARFRGNSEDNLAGVGSVSRLARIWAIASKIMIDRTSQRNVTFLGAVD